VKLIVSFTRNQHFLSLGGSQNLLFMALLPFKMDSKLILFVASISGQFFIDLGSQVGTKID